MSKVTPLLLVLLLGPTEASAFDHTHRAWTEILRRHVKEGVVSYGGIRSEKQALSAYLEQLQRADRSRFSKEQRLAFWLNAYNAHTVSLILEHYPLKSIRDIGFWPLAAFRQRFIPIRALDESQLSLNNIENDLLRKRFTEPRIHFALVCASKSCPPLRSEAYRASDLSAQLDDQTQIFLTDKSKNRYDEAKRTLYLSKIFDWFEEDFKGVVAFVAPYLGRELKADVTIDYLDYDWTLNGR